jgi:putative SOS response-associated peptidase YedK
MCGRYATPEQQAIARRWHIGRDNNNPYPPFAARYNVTPQQGNPGAYVPAVRHGTDGEPELAMMQWWLLPHWAKEPRIDFSTFNARTDKVASAASYRVPFRKRRCVIPALGWFEWQATLQGKVKWWLHRPDRGIVGFAGLWDRWHRGDTVIESCTIIVGPANAAMQNVHDRMPVIIQPEDEAFWLDTKIDATQALETLLTPPSDDAITAHIVRSDKRPRDDDPTLIDPIDTLDTGAR